MKFIYIGIGRKYRGELLLYGIMDLRAFQLLFQAAHDRRGQDDVTDGTQPDNQDLHTPAIFGKVNKAPRFWVIFAP